MISSTNKSSNSSDGLRLHKFLPRSQANGPGTRAVIWVQGCTLGCPGCFNGPTHPAVGQLRPVDELFEEIVALTYDIEGITISGGEPLQQLPGVTQLLHRIKTETTLSVVLFTGFSWPELERMGQAQTQAHKQSSGNQDAGRYPLPVLEYVDVLIAGRYNQELHLAQDLRGSSNKQLYFLTGLYTEADFHAVPRTEVVISAQGDIILSGINPLNLTNIA